MYVPKVNHILNQNQITSPVNQVKVIPLQNHPVLQDLLFVRHLLDQAHPVQVAEAVVHHLQEEAVAVKDKGKQGN